MIEGYNTSAYTKQTMLTSIILAKLARFLEEKGYTDHFSSIQYIKLEDETCVICTRKPTLNGYLKQYQSDIITIVTSAYSMLGLRGSVRFVSFR